MSEDQANTGTDETRGAQPARRASDCYAVRCFRRSPPGEKRHGIWIMTQPDGPNKHRGVFVHGDHDEFQAPQYSVDDLEKFATRGGWFPCEEITPEQAVAELENWYEGRLEILRVLERHKVEA